MTSFQAGEKKVRLLLFADYMILYLGNPKNFVKKKNPIRTNKSVKLQDSKFSYRRVTFPYAKSNLPVKKSRKHFSVQYNKNFNT